LKSELSQERERYIESQRKLEKIQSFFTAQTQKIAEQKAELTELRSQITKEFELIANKVLQDKSDRFNESSHKSLYQILDPFKENLKTFEAKVDRVYHEE